jgi:hypothetical protein
MNGLNKTNEFQGFPVSVMVIAAEATLHFPLPAAKDAEAKPGSGSV